MFKLTGVDLFQIPGLNTEILLILFSELGTDMTRWPTEKHFASWLCLCPGTKMSGGRVISRKTHPSSNKAAIAFHQAAISASRTQIGAFYRRLKSRLGPSMAATATAHKIARLYYNLLKHGQQYLEAGANSYEEKYRSRIVNNLKRHARSLDYELTPVAA